MPAMRSSRNFALATLATGTAVAAMFAWSKASVLSCKVFFWHVTLGCRYSATRMAEIPIGFERAPTFDDRNFRQKEKGNGGVAALTSMIAKKSRKS